MASRFMPLRALIHDGVLPDDAVMAARFLHQFNHKLDKVHLGTLLAEKCVLASFSLALHWSHSF
jgi:hypothetical protein